MNALNISLSSDLDLVGRLDALTGIREALWGIHPLNILRSVVEEVAGDSPEDQEDQDEDIFRSNTKSKLENHSINIEVIDGLTLAVNIAYSRRNQQFAAVVTSLTLETNGKTFVFNEKFALEMNVDVLGKDANSSFSDFVDYHQRLADESQPTGNEDQIDTLIEYFFDFTDIESVW